MQRTTKQTTVALTILLLAAAMCAAQEADAPDPGDGTIDQPTPMSGDGYTLVGLFLPAGTEEMTARDFATLGSLPTDGETGCYADCDQSTGLDFLDIFDFLCFQNSFVNAEPYACECDTSTGPGVCDLLDFICFQSAFVAGCP